MDPRESVSLHHPITMVRGKNWRVLTYSDIQGWARNSSRAPPPSLPPEVSYTREEVESNGWLPSYPSFVGHSWRNLFFTSSTQSSKVETPLLGGGSRKRNEKGRKQIRISEGIKGTWFLLDASGLQQEDSSQASGSVPVKNLLTGSAGTPIS